MNDTRDAGWQPALRPVWRLLVPWIPLFWRRTDFDLIGLRRIFLHTALGLIELTIAMQWTLEDADGRAGTLSWVLLAAGTVWALGGFTWSNRTSLATDSAEALAGQFRALSFIRLGMAAAPALWAAPGPTSPTPVSCPSSGPRRASCSWPPPRQRDPGSLASSSSSGAPALRSR